MGTGKLVKAIRAAMCQKKDTGERIYLPFRKLAGALKKSYLSKTRIPAARINTASAGLANEFDSLLARMPRKP